MRELFVSCIIVWVFRVMLLVSSWFCVVRVWILSNIIMLWRSDGLIMSVVVFGCVYAKCIAFAAMVVVLPVCLAMQAMMRFDWSFSKRCWYG
jgi:hypothetical protein